VKKGKKQVATAAAVAVYITDRARK